MEVGIEDCLHIEFEYNKSRYHLRDTVVGKIYFLLVSQDAALMPIITLCRRAVCIFVAVGLRSHPLSNCCQRSPDLLPAAQHV